ncbi:MAG: hypothetical protein KDC57_10115, partial [Saprospiraceae bacterium]|nr:hypothetical protein [Saprospiraceae bacterium]
FVNVRYPRAFTRLPEGWIRLDSFSNAQSVAVDSLQSRWAAWNPELGQYLEVNDSLLVFPSAPNSSSWYLGSMDSIRRIKSLMPASFSDLSTTGQLIFITHPAFLPEVEKYAAYRASSEGGGWTTTILNSEALINTFAYGIERHPLSIKNAIQAVARNSTEEHYIFLIGKSLEYPTKRNDPSLPVWLPSYGEPAGDNLMVARAFADVPTFPVGRLAVTEPGQILEYLQKVKTYEENQHTLPSTYEDRIWTKRILHLSAGSAPAEQTIIHNALDAMAQEAESNRMGAEVKTVAKENTEVLAISQTNEILNALNDGVLLKTYFGHGSVVTTQFVIDQATQLNNAGKNPMMYSLGCYTGNIHTPILSASENMVLHPSLGAIGYVATSGTGYISALSFFEQEHYRVMGTDWYGAPFGKIMQQSVAAVSNQQNIPMQLIREEITYQGDPVIRLHLAQGPDFTFKPQSVSVEPQLVTATADSFTVQMTIANLGEATADSVVLKIDRQFPDGSLHTVYSRPVPAPAAEKMVSLRLPVGTSAAGENQLYISLDPENAIAEWPDPDAENNNEYGAGFSFRIVSQAIEPVYPANYGIVPATDLTLYAAVSNGAANGNQYRAELDSLPDFSSPMRISSTLTTDGAIATWHPGWAWIQDQVYYWRIRPDSVMIPSDTLWHASSFLISDSLGQGWNQSHWGQWDDDTLVTLEIDREGLRYSIRQNNLLIRSSIADPPTTAWWINSDRYDRHWPISGRIRAGIHICVLDSASLLPWYNPPGGKFGSVNQLDYDRPSFPFEMQDSSILDSIFYLLDLIPDGYYVLFQTVQYGDTSYFPQHWAIPNQYNQETLFGFLEAQGAEDLAAIQAGHSVPYIFLFRKNRGKVAERIAKDVNEWIDVSVTINTTLHQGQLITPTIGPVQAWNRLEWRATRHPGDTMTWQIIPVDWQGVEKAPIRIDADADQGFIGLDSLTTPNLRVTWFSRDDEEQSPPDLRYLRLINQGLPDLVWKQMKVTSPQPAQAGEMVQIQGVCQNVSNQPMAAFTIAATLEAAGLPVITDTMTVSGLGAFAEVNINFTLPGPLYGGNYIWKTTLNPAGVQQQAETRLDNNTSVGLISIAGDAIAPVLDVTFDGKYIPDQGIVSPEPVIRIRLYEEQQILLLDDTSLFTITLLDPEGNENPVLLSRGDLSFFPALPGMVRNEAMIRWVPTFWTDGLYVLTIRARDKSGNLAGGDAYIQRFRIQSVTDLMQVTPYPNPFSESIRWVFTADQTGVLPELRLSLYQANGQRIRTWENGDLNAKTTGNRIWEFTWDGRDDGGEQVAAGVYFYKVERKEAQSGFKLAGEGRLVYLPE